MYKKIKNAIKKLIFRQPISNSCENNNKNDTFRDQFRGNRFRNTRKKAVQVKKPFL